jgi:hypothetical protein
VREVVAPDGRIWQVSRRWTRRRVRWRRVRQEREGSGRWWEALDALDVLHLADLHPALAVVGVVAVVLVAAVVGALFVVPLLLAVVDVLVIAAVLVVGGLVRTLLGRPWEVEARTGGPPAEERTWRVRGWRDSDRAVEQVARGLGAGLTDPAPDIAPPAR